MRIVIAGAGSTGINVAKRLIEDGHDIIIVESDEQKIAELSEELDCSFIHGDTTEPETLKEIDPQAVDCLICLTDKDHANILTSLLARSLKYKRIITSIQNEDLEALCSELELEDTIIPMRMISRHITDIIHSKNTLELSTLIKGNARFYSFRIKRDDEKKVSNIKLPENTRIIYLYRADELVFINENTELEEDDEVVILTTVDNLKDLEERWSPIKPGEETNKKKLKTKLRHTLRKIFK